MSRIRLLALAFPALGLVLLGLALAPAALAGTQLYSGSWVADSFGNDKVGGKAASEFFSVFAMPQGVLCNAGQPRCNLSSTPTDGGGKFNALGGTNKFYAQNCQPLSLFGTGATVRPSKGGTNTTIVLTKKGKSIPLPTPYAPRYRNTHFFNPGGSPKTTFCTAYTTVSGANATAPLTTNDPLRGVVMKGAPLTGKGTVSTTAAGPGKAFKFAAAPATPMYTGTLVNKNGFRRTTQGEFANIYPYIYSYTYFTFRNSAGDFGPGQGFFTASAAPTTVSIPYNTGMATVAKAKVTKGANNFGGVMRLLGQNDTKVCYFNKQGCGLGGADWLYEYVGTSGYTNGAGVVTAGYIKNGTEKYYHSVLQTVSTFTVKATRFPWTTGTVTLTALGRGPHRTTEVRKGYDNRTTASGKGTVQLVSPILTHWLVPTFEFETGGIGIMRIQFLPEPSKWMMLVAGLSMLGVLYRYRGR